MAGGPAGAHAGGGFPGMYDEGMDMYGYGSMAGPVETEARRYVSVRGVFPIRQQELELAKAMGAQSVAEVVQLLQFSDFELERQRAVPGDDPWSSEWQKVDIQVALDVLNEQAQFDVDVVDPTTTNAVFTMPLPARVMGQWTDENASHPSLSQFETTEDARKQEQWLQEKIAEYGRLLEEQEKQIPKIGGFGGQQWDARTLGGMMLGDEDYMSGMMSSMPGIAGGMTGARGQANQPIKQLTKEQIQSMLSASGTYLLFRYLDFDVRPGNAYRYRVRLQVFNPNYNRDVGEVARRDVAEGEHRFTEWSEPTSPVIVPKDTRAFLVDLAQANVNQPDRATFKLFQWSEETGTIIDGSLDIEPGQFISGQTETEVLDPGAQTFETKDFTFTSNDVLVDVDRNATALAMRPELGLNRREFRIPPQVLIVNDWGGLEVQDPISTADNRQEWDAFLKDIDEKFAYLKEQAQAAVAGEEGEGYEAMMEMYGGMMGGGNANPLRRGGRGRAGGAGAAGAHSGGGGAPGGRSR